MCRRLGALLLLVISLLADPETRLPSPAEASYASGLSFIANGKPQEACPHFEDAYRLGLQHMGVVLQLVRCQFALGQEDAAVDILDGVVQKTSSPNLLLETGKLLFDRVLYQQARVPVEKAWRAQPGS